MRTFSTSSRAPLRVAGDRPPRRAGRAVCPVRSRRAGFARPLKLRHAPHSYRHADYRRDRQLSRILASQRKDLDGQRVARKVTGPPCANRHIEPVLTKKHQISQCILINLIGLANVQPPAVLQPKPIRVIYPRRGALRTWLAVLRSQERRRPLLRMPIRLAPSGSVIAAGAWW